MAMKRGVGRERGKRWCGGWRQTIRKKLGDSGIEAKWAELYR